MAVRLGYKGNENNTANDSYMSGIQLLPYNAEKFYFLCNIKSYVPYSLGIMFTTTSK